MTAQEINQTNAGRNVNAAGTGLQGAIVIGVVNASLINPQTDDFGYNFITD